MYYQLDNFYQNHRRYVKSRSNEQLMGNILEVSALEDCDPIKTNADLGESKLSVSGKSLVAENAAMPCGLVAKSFFTDEFTLKLGDVEQKIVSDNIAW